MSKVKEFLKKHEKEVMITGGFILGFSATFGCVVVYKKYIEGSKKAFLYTPKRAVDGKYQITFGVVTKRNKYQSFGTWNADAESAVKLAKYIIKAVSKEE